ncbi:single-stranded DNA-binding protein [Streptomyces ficellus]|uniref:Single-stranded DNA-binding protein n=1 Tax=Streptomyces ficellus TaxID=1977088 RepID=A0A6I6FA34_9ACTN|nr:single-stranded DNA-binding protein [Streptomyces ficellus]QGV80580.1 single-stranded DNA-binding protein [Streptomyces ficellus]
MNDTMVTVVGNVATSVDYRDTAMGGVAKFRFAATARRWDREKAAWVDGHTSFCTVSAWRALAANLAASVSVGDPLVVHGRLRVREEDWDGQRRTFVDLEASAAGHDLTRGTSAFRRVTKGEPRAADRTGDGSEPAGAGGDGGATGTNGTTGTTGTTGSAGAAGGGAADRQAELVS